MTLRLDSARSRLVAELVGVAFQAGRVLVRGPWGIGKTTLVLEAARAAREAGIRVAYCPRTRSLANVVAALEQTYASAVGAGISARQRRSALRLASERDAGLLILDGLRAGGTVLVGFLRSLRGKQLAVIAAADIEHPRDLVAARASGIAYREVIVPPLAVRDLSRFLEQLSQKYPLPFELGNADRLALLNLAAGQPGVLERAWARLRAGRYWRSGLPLVEAVGADLRMEWLAETSEMAVKPGRLN